MSKQKHSTHLQCANRRWTIWGKANVVLVVHVLNGEDVFKKIRVLSPERAFLFRFVPLSAVLVPSAALGLSEGSSAVPPSF
jgi:hypothetical protein